MIQIENDVRSSPSVSNPDSVLGNTYHAPREVSEPN
jgi:hypothetical protein